MSYENQNCCMFNLGIFISLWKNEVRKYSVFNTEFGAEHFKEITGKVLRKIYAWGGESASSGVRYLKYYERLLQNAVYLLKPLKTLIPPLKYVHTWRGKKTNNKHKLSGVLWET